MNAPEVGARVDCVVELRVECVGFTDDSGSLTVLKTEASPKVQANEGSEGERANFHVLR
jgi:hypothetical protein